MKKYSAFFTAIFLIIVLVSCKETPHKSVLDDKYFDWSYPYSYTFVLNENQYQAKSITNLNETQYQSYLNTEPLIVYLFWDHDSHSVLVSKENHFQGKKYLLFKSEEAGIGILLVPTEAQLAIFEEKRPLAFYVEPVSSSTGGSTGDGSLGRP